MYADVVSTVALLLSVLSISWAAYQSLKWNRPVLRVHGDISVFAHSNSISSDWLCLTVQVENLGDQTTQVLGAGWDLDNPRVAYQRYDLISFGRGADAERPGGTAGTHLEKYERLHRAGNYDRASANPFLIFERARPYVTYLTRRGETTLFGEWRELAWLRSEVEIRKLR